MSDLYRYEYCEECLHLLKVADPESYEKMKDILKKNERKEEKKEKDNFLEEDNEID